MNPEIKARWIAALRSGDYRQGRDRLRDGVDRFCCLGVLCDLAEQDGIARSVMPPPYLDDPGGTVRYAGVNDHELEPFFLPPAVMEWSGVVGARGDLPPGADFLNLAEANDGHADFHEIANLIDVNL